MLLARSLNYVSCSVPLQHDKRIHTRMLTLIDYYDNATKHSSQLTNRKPWVTVMISCDNKSLTWLRQNFGRIWVQKKNIVSYLFVYASAAYQIKRIRQHICRRIIHRPIQCINYCLINTSHKLVLALCRSYERPRGLTTDPSCLSYPSLQGLRSNDKILRTHAQEKGKIPCVNPV